MGHENSDDVPSPIDLRSEGDARDWTALAMSLRPWRTLFFQRFVDELRSLNARPLQILELGSGPGFLARCVLDAITDAKYTMLDFSPAMHCLARERLGTHVDRTRQVLADFKQADWSDELGYFDAIVTHQAVHELRHKKHAVALHKSARSLLMPGGFYLVCDHYVGSDGTSNTALYMTVDEQRAVLNEAGSSSIVNLLQTNGLVLHRAHCNS
jgi:ubiquinone/menaquinone biosynthesis C-methylase UbiE